MNGEQQQQPKKKYVLENPTEGDLDFVLFLGDRVHNEVIVLEISVPPESELDLDCFPHVESGRVVPLRVAPPGRTLGETKEIIAKYGHNIEDKFTHVSGVFLACDGGVIQNFNRDAVRVTAYIGTRQPGPDGRPTFRTESLTLPAGADVKLPAEDKAEYVLWADAGWEDILKILKRDGWAAMNKRGRKKGRGKERRRSAVG